MLPLKETDLSLYSDVIVSLLLFLIEGTVCANKTGLDDWCYHPVGDDCSWYTQCLVKRFPCEAANDSYAIGFGDTICKEFSKNRPDFTELGKRWIDETRACLQKKLTPVLRVDHEMTCQEIQAFAFQTHSLCYSDPPKGTPSFCELPFTDWLKVTWIVKQSFFRETWETLKQGAQILSHCTARGITGALFGK